MKFVTLLLAASLLASPALAGVEFVKNGSFDLNTMNDGDKLLFNSAGVSDWFSGGNLTFLASPGTADDPALWLSVYPGFPHSSPDGGDFVLANGDPEFSAPIFQEISGLIVGETYVLSFYHAAGQQADYPGDTTEQWKVTFGDDTQYSKLFELPEGGFAPWEQQTMSFVATAGTQVLTFLAEGTPGGAPPISFLDGVSLQGPAVPEPATWAMMLLGFGAVGFSVRRRNARVAA